MSEANVAVLVDYENVGLDTIQYLLDQLSDVGRIIIKRAYADWSVEKNKRDQLLELGIEAVHHFRSTKSGKNSSDICLAIDAVDLLYGSPVDTFVIVSSDSDFVPLISKLRAAGKTAIGSGRRNAASQTLIRSCDRYIYLDDAKPAPEKSRTRTPRSRQTNVDSLLNRAMQASMDEEGRAVGSKLHQTMVRIDPSFNFRGMGHRTFRQFLEASNEVQVSQPSGASDVIVSLNHSRGNVTPPPAPTNGTASAPAQRWDREVDVLWSARQKPRISGQAAAADAAKALSVTKLSASSYPSLDKLLEASEYLRSRWKREGNSVIKI